MTLLPRLGRFPKPMVYTRRLGFFPWLRRVFFGDPVPDGGTCSSDICSTRIVSGNCVSLLCAYHCSLYCHCKQYLVCETCKQPRLKAVP
jgi:hypothetical protein